jgi:CubicO group peptidase (beta-lactamase class C family)
MTAGLNYDMQTPALKEYYEACDHRCPTVEVVNVIAKTPLEFEPGTGWRYSLCHDVLAALVEVLSGEGFQDYVKTHIFQVAGMQDSTFMLPPEELETVAPQYRFADGKVENIGKEIFQFKIGSQYASGGAGCIDDFIKLFQTLPKVDAGLAASIFHFGQVQIRDLKERMAEQGIPTRL